ncbi:MAG: folate-binding protein [Neisseriaceae bacterium]
MLRYCLNSFGVIKVRGADRVDFLHSQFSNDIKGLHCDEACYATYNDSRGRMWANFLVCSLKDCILLILKKDLVELVIQKLKRYLFRSRVELSDESACYILIGMETPETRLAFPHPVKFPFLCIQEEISLPCPNGTTLQLKNHSMSPLAEENGWNLLEIERGTAWISSATTERCIPQMLNQEWLGAIHFKKGCYPGQEIIARAQYRGKVRRKPALLTATKHFPIGTLLKEKNGVEVGIIFNVAKTEQLYYYLAVVKTDSDKLLYVDETIDSEKLNREHFFLIEGDLKQ